MILAYLLTLVITVSLRTITEKLIQNEFKDFIQKFNKKYDQIGSIQRFEIFKTNLNYIKTKNSQNLTYKLGIGPFADLTYKEFDSKYLKPKNFLKTSKSQNHTFFINQTNLPKKVNWLKLNRVVPSKHQWSCGSCYIFASIASVESAISIYYNSAAQALSEQKVLDCNLNSSGCKGGHGYDVFEFLMKEKCLIEEKFYPYEAKQSKCKKIPKCVNGFVKNWKKVISNNEVQLMAAVAQQPVCASFFSSEIMQHYESGVVPFDTCTDQNSTNHEVLVFGYGSNKLKDYWIAKNSWGNDWGMNGCFFVERNPFNKDSGGTCLIASFAIYPIISS